MQSDQWGAERYRERERKRVGADISHVLGVVLGDRGVEALADLEGQRVEVLCIERLLEGGELVEDHPHGPHVHAPVVLPGVGCVVYGLDYGIP